LNLTSMSTCEASYRVTFLTLKDTFADYLWIILVYFDPGQIDIPLSNIVSSDYSNCHGNE
jgi:hypothetical protein